MNLVAYVNGTFLPLDQATVHIEDRGFQFADGVYEVVAALGGSFLDLNPHLERLKRSCEAIRIPLPCPLDEMAFIATSLYSKNPFRDAMLYIQITRGVAPRSHHIQNTLKPSLIMTVRELPRPSEEKLAHGATAITREDIRWKRCDIKSIALLASVLGKYEADSCKVDETFWLDRKGHLLEGCATNAYAVINSTVVTHPLDHQVLGGIMRDMALRIATAEGLKVEERPWKLSEEGLTECMMSSTTNALLPVCYVDGEAIGSGQPGPVALKIRASIINELEALRCR